MSQSVPSNQTFSIKDFVDHLHPDEYQQLLQQTSGNGPKISKDLLTKISTVLQAWAKANGVSQYCHWFQPLTGLTAEKHDSFVDYDQSQNIVHLFSGLNLVKGEADASSLPSGSVRQSFEARGYTIWDPSSQIFIKQQGQSKIMCIPSVFCSYSGEILDEKTPLLKAHALMSDECSKLLNKLGMKCDSVQSIIGPEQEYFLIDEECFDQRIDLQQVGRTLFGAAPAKTQQMQDQYYGSIPTKVLDFMEEVNSRLSNLNIPVKTQHNEVAPHQHEIVCLHSNALLSVNQNLIVMQTLQSVAENHKMRCLLNEKPFKNVNGSGKHNNWSLSAGDVNLFSQKQNPHFVLFLTMVMAAVDRYQELLCYSVATYQNSTRLGSHEAPPAIMSMYVGEQLEKVISTLSNIENLREQKSVETSPFLQLADQLPKIPLDNSDRNRTSPFAFTGNKFEFRMPGSSQNLCFCNTVLLAAFAQICKEVSAELDQAEPANQHTSQLKEIPSRSLVASKNSENQIKITQIARSMEREIACRLATAHKRIVFNGNNYSTEWIIEAKARGLSQLSRQDTLRQIVSLKAVELFAPIMTERELHIRFEVAMNQFVQSGFIEANLVLQMLSQTFIPFILRQVGAQVEDLKRIQEAGGEVLQIRKQILNYAAKLGDLVSFKNQLQAVLLKMPKSIDLIEEAQKIHREVREIVDWFEVQFQGWPVPTYGEMMK